ncbi:response regulator : Chemotaxis response regulator protein-glutamate methylesterase OS=Candidatus Methylomirabilis oxyfera GN=cheB PE=3 SV=1: Response_reg: CheB_methylest [Gemmataceae bacterium]|nr:response regulator : Chemotaxis response regulator protein-glutamate methylesterase OS=Candidatus Methylomirabilis oxyfera GN=cheB PE=3 SV=1: Response_reg: CheB_methylest [Gemmataceae bacterium]VTT97871.1 response regulator : Chemotaxis response regulator protein-glutamate methylesterase OS=Candidatus Methylomirabilis oxyfera GN=cheB PE=3 SV=1: Response_reg: CheB_methylest [Gemmataceae bacterium]
MARTKVLVVDDSALMRQLLTDILSRDRELEVVGAAADPYAAWDKIKLLAPDVLTLDVEMPRMDGLTFLERLMSARPLPVLMVSSLTERNCETTFRALEAGAVDFVTKPKLDVSTNTLGLAEELVAKVKAAARARVRPRAKQPPPPRPGGGGFRTTHKVIAVGASTGGCEALAVVLGQLPADAPGAVAVIHMPEGFTRSFATRLDRCCAVRVSEAKDGDRVVPGHALIAPGNFHLEVVRSGAVTAVRVRGGPPVNRHRPAVDVLFQSCARELGQNAVGAILTGMGGDGACGLLEMRRAGARTVAQDEATCVVFGMPKEAIALGAAAEVLPLERIAPRLVQLTAD